VKKFLPVLVAALITVSCGSDSRQTALNVGREIADMSMAHLEIRLDGHVSDIGPLGASALTPSAIRARYDSTGTRPQMAGIWEFLDQSALHTEGNADAILQQIKDSGNFTDIDFESLKDLEMKGTAIAGLSSAMWAIHNEMDRTLDIYQSNMDSLTETFGKEETAIINMAALEDIDLVTDAEYFKYVLEKLPQSGSALTFTELAELVELAKLAEPLTVLEMNPSWNCTEDYQLFFQVDCPTVKSFADSVNKLIKELDPNTETGS